MSSKILPCPFCGGEPVLKQYRADGLEIKCSSCHSGRQQRWMYKGRDWLEAKMIEKWNERAAPVVERQEPVAVAWKYKTRVFVQALGYVWREVIELEAPNLDEVAARDLTPLYTSPPAPVAVVLPERGGISNRPNFNEGWNACIEKVKELNQ